MPVGTPASIQVIADEETAPNPAGFTVPTGATTSWTVEGIPSNTLNYGTLLAGEWLGIWLRREVPAGAEAYSNRSCTLRFEGETTASPAVIVIQDLVFNWKDKGFEVLQLPPQIFQG